MSIAALEFRPCKPSQISFVHTCVYHSGCKFSKGELECPSILSVAEIFVGVVGGDSAEGVLGPEEFGEPSRSGHETPVDLSLVSREEICLDVT